MPSTGKNVIRFSASDWFSGLSPQYEKSANALPSMLESGATAMKAIDPFRALGYLLPCPNPAAPTNVSEIDAVLLNIAYGRESSTYYGYMIEAGTQLHRLDLSAYTVSNSGSWPHTITGSGTVSGDDCIAYPVNVSSTRTRSILYSWNDSGGAWNIGKFNVEAGTFDDDWFTTVPAGAITPSGNGKRHPMIVGADDICYVADGNKVHAIDGATGADATISEAVLPLPENTQISCFAKMDNYLVIFAYSNSAGDLILTSPSAGTTNATAYFWDYLSLDPTFVIPLNDDYVSCAVSYKNTVACFTGGSKSVREYNAADRTGRLKIYNGAVFETVAQYIGTPPLKGGAHVVNDAIQFISRSGTDLSIFSYGSPFEGVSAGLNILYDCTGTSSTTGFYTVTPGGSGYPIASSGIQSSGGLERWTANYDDSALFITGAAVPQLGSGQTARVKSVTVCFGTTMSSAGRSIAVQLITDSADTTTVLTGIDQITTDNIISKKTFDSSGGQIPRFQELRASIVYSSGSGATDAPAIRYIDVEYETDNAYPR